MTVFVGIKRGKWYLYQYVMSADDKLIKTVLAKSIPSQNMARFLADCANEKIWDKMVSVSELSG